MSLIVQYALALLVTYVTAQNCPTQPMTPEFRRRILDRHNVYRSQIASGTAKLPTGHYARRGKNMYKLVYDCKLEEKAQEWANRCVYDHSPDSWRNSGESIHQTYASYDLQVDGQKLEAAADYWGKELEKYGIDDSYKYHRGLYNIGHWTQMVWGKTLRVGCGVKHCPWMDGWKSAVFTVCHYLEQGNMFTTPIFEFGNGCSRDSDCTMLPGSTCEQSTNLCIQPGSSPVTRPKPVTRPPPVIVNPRPGPTTTTCDSRVMTPVLRDYVSRYLNGFRSQVVKGKAQNRRPGRNMYQLTYDCGLEAKVEQFIKRCDIDARDAGTIMYYDASNQRPLTTKNAIQSSITKWKAILRGDSFSSYVYSSQMQSEVFALTQMLWGSSTRVGCSATVDCVITYKGRQYDTSITACRFERAGNIDGEEIYESGTPCRRNSDCTTFSGSSCDATKGLCIAP